MLSRPAMRLPRPRMGQFQMPAPVGGLNLRDSIAQMPGTDALVLNNWVPQDSYLELRGGHASHATGVGSTVRGFLLWAAPNGTQRLFAASQTALYNVSSAGAVGAAVRSGMSNRNINGINFTTSGGSYLVSVNGVDPMLVYDGLSFSEPSITGYPSNDFIYVHSHKSRLWFAAIASTKAYYLEPSAIAGPAAEFEVGNQFTKGGYLVGIGTISRDGGQAGSDDLLAFISSRGEVVVYEGDDPASAATWNRLGIYSASPPIQRRFLVTIGGDLSILTETGIISGRQLMMGDRIAAERTAITDKINRGLKAAFASYGSNAGWQLTYYARASLLMINIPTSSSTASQYVMNTRTGAWSTFSGLNGTSWAYLNEDPYFGNSLGTVYRADYGKQDLGSAITTEMKPAFQRLNGGGLFRMTKIRPNFTAGNTISPGIKVDVDYRDSTPAIPTDQFPAYASATGSIYGSGAWGTNLWAASLAGNPFANWIDASAIGNAAAIHMVTSTDGFNVILNAIDVQFEKAQGLAL